MASTYTLYICKFHKIKSGQVPAQHNPPFSTLCYIRRIISHSFVLRWQDQIIFSEATEKFFSPMLAWGPVDRKDLLLRDCEEKRYSSGRVFIAASTGVVATVCGLPYIRAP